MDRCGKGELWAGRAAGKRDRDAVGCEWKESCGRGGQLKEIEVLRTMKGSIAVGGGNERKVTK